jgi:RNA polymerase sigma factor (sigma-70 family)
MLLRYLRRAGYFSEEGRPTDGQLLERFVAQREEAAFEELVRRHGPMVLGVCRRALHNEHDVEDAFQATFLVLVRKARSVKPRDLVGHWLYGVAYRTALRARSLDARRRDKEKAMPRPAAPSTGLWQDVMPLLDRELSGLPEKYRIPVVLCDLEGKSRKEVAGILGCSEGTLSSRLARARSLLAQRLSRRGVTLSGGALAALVAADGVLACVSAPLLSSTTKAALLIAAGQEATAACVSLQAVALTEGVVRTMLLGKLKTMALLCAVATVAIGAGGFAYQAQAEKGNSNLTAARQDPGRPTPVQDERREGANRQGTEKAEAQPNVEPQQAGPGLPRDAANRLKQFEAEAEAIRKKADAEIQALRDILLPELEALLDAYAKAGKLDEAVVIRDRLRLLKAERQRTQDLVAHAKDKTRNLLVNGSFEEGPPLPENGVHVVPFQAGSTAIKGWVVTRRGGGVWDYTYFQPLDGKRMGGASGHSPAAPEGGAISQTFKTRSGQKYRVSFWLAGDAITQHGEKRMQVAAGGKTAEFVFDTTGKTRQDMGWVRRIWEFKAEADETTLEFSSLTKGMFGGVVFDDVVVVAVNE